MFPLFSAIQRKAWTRARKLCYELVLCDPERPSYQELYVRLERIITLGNRRSRSYSNTSQTRIASGDKEKSEEQQDI
jgi:hypothetical protein